MQLFSKAHKTGELRTINSTADGSYTTASARICGRCHRLRRSRSTL